MKKYRVRDKCISFRVTEYEAAVIKENIRVSGSGTEEYLRNAAMHGYIVNVNYSELKDLIYEINKIGVNINQVAHRVNANGTANLTDIEALKRDMDNIWHQLNLQLKKAQKIAWLEKE